MALVLVVDDDPGIRSVVGLLLEDEGHQVVQAADGIAALEAVQAHRPDLIVLDLMMPRLGGADVLEALHPRERPPVMLLSASPKAVDIARQHEVRTVRKPFDADFLLHAVAELLSGDTTSPGRPAERWGRRIEE